MAIEELLSELILDPDVLIHVVVFKAVNSGNQLVNVLLPRSEISRLYSCDFGSHISELTHRLLLSGRHRSGCICASNA